MHRRDVLRSLGALALGPALAPLPASDILSLGRRIHDDLIQQGAALRVLDARRAPIAAALADTILPRTDTPGALDAGAVEFLDRLLADWHTDEERRDFLAGFDGLDAKCREATGRSFHELDQAGRIGFLTPVDAALPQSPPPARGSPEAAYARLKSVTIFAFLTSRPIREGVLKTPIIPGRFDGCIPVSPGGE